MGYERGGDEVAELRAEVAGLRTAVKGMAARLTAFEACWEEVFEAGCRCGRPAPGLRVVRAGQGGSAGASSAARAASLPGGAA